MQEHITKPKKSLYEPKSPPQNTLLNDLIVLLALQTAAATGKERVWGHFESSAGGKDRVKIRPAKVSSTVLFSVLAIIAISVAFMNFHYCIVYR